MQVLGKDQDLWYADSWNVDILQHKNAKNLFQVGIGLLERGMMQSRMGMKAKIWNDFLLTIECNLRQALDVIHKD
jgi:hypothetical protein